MFGISWRFTSSLLPLGQRESFNPTRVTGLTVNSHDPRRVKIMLEVKTGSQTGLFL